MDDRVNLLMRGCICSSLRRHRPHHGHESSEQSSARALYNTAGFGTSSATSLPRSRDVQAFFTVQQLSGPPEPIMDGSWAVQHHPSNFQAHSQPRWTNRVALAGMADALGKPCANSQNFTRESTPIASTTCILLHSRVDSTGGLARTSDESAHD